MSAEEAKSDERADLFAVRSILFLPASNPRAIAKARASEAELVVLDLEDAVKPGDKASARAAAVEAVADAWPMPVAIRVNGAGTEWHSVDLKAVAGSNADFAVVPRASSAHLLRTVREVVARPMLAMVETAAGVLAASEIASESEGLIAGTNDLRADLRLPPSASRDNMSAALQIIVLAARAGGVAVFDGVFNNLDDADGFRVEAEAGRALGFDGKSLIHPDQIAPCHQAFAPTEEEVAEARALVSAFSGGAERFKDAMIERMHVVAAQRLLERAGG
jgi:citrate lyase beta subunit